MTTQLETPLAFIIFNRPEPTRRVFEEIRKARPRELFILADGPRTSDEQTLCATTRAVTENIDWDCTVHRRYLEKNLGVRYAPSSGISWVFEHVERAIFLEDDCLPHPEFFPYCTELLERYKNDARVMHISGDNFQQLNPTFKIPESYYFSVIPHIWGWATWKRAWEKYDVEISMWPEVEKTHLLKNALQDPAVLDRWEYVFRRYYRKEIGSWDGQWAFTCLINGGLAATPRVNMISNIGFGAEAFSSKDPHHKFANMEATSIGFPLMHPIAMLPNRSADAYSFVYVFDINRRLRDRVRWFCKYYFRDIYDFMRVVTGRKNY